MTLGYVWETIYLGLLLSIKNGVLRSIYLINKKENHKGVIFSKDYEKHFLAKKLHFLIYKTWKKTKESN